MKKIISSLLVAFTVINASAYSYRPCYDYGTAASLVNEISKLITYNKPNGKVVAKYEQNISNAWITEELKKQNPSVLFVTINENDLPSLTKEYGITDTPNLLFIKNDQIVYSLYGQGPLTSSLQELINAYLS